MKLYNYNCSGKGVKQVELSRATLEFSFTSPNKISGQNISVWVQNFFGQSKYWVGENFGLKKFPNKLFDPDEIVGPKKV